MPTLCKSWAKIGLGICLLLLNTGCNGGSNTDAPTHTMDAQPHRGGTIVARATSDPETLNRFAKNLGFISEIENYVFPYLMSQDFNTMEMLPHLAKESPEIADEGKTYIFHLRENATWADGTPVTSEDVVFTWKLMMLSGIVLPNFATYYHSILENVEVDPNDRFRVVFKLQHKMQDGEAALGGMAIYPRHLWDPDNLLKDFSVNEALTDLDRVMAMDKVKAFKTLFESDKYRNSPEIFQGSGPYKLAAYVPGEKVELQRVENWWGDQIVSEDWMWQNYPDKIVYRFIPDNSAAIAELKAGNLDACPYIPSPDFLSLSKETGTIAENWRFIQQPRMVTIQVLMNQNPVGSNRPPYFEDLKVRKAMDLLMDKKMVLETVFDGLAEYLDGPVPRTMAKFVSPNLKPTQLDIEKAKALLSEAGWEDTNNDGTRDKMIHGKRVEFKPEFLYNVSSEASAKTFAIFTDACQKAGITLKENGMAATTFHNNYKAHNFDLAMTAGATPPVTPDFRESWHSESWASGTNYGGLAHPDVDSLIMVARETFDNQARKQLIYQLQDLIVSQQPCIWLVSSSEKFGVSKKWDGVATFPMSPYILYSGMWLANSPEKANAAEDH